MCIKRNMHRQLCVPVVVYLKEIMGTFLGASFALKCESSESNCTFCSFSFPFKLYVGSRPRAAVDWPSQHSCIISKLHLSRSVMVLCLFTMLVGRSCAVLSYFSLTPPSSWFTLSSIAVPTSQQGKWTIHPDRHSLLIMQECCGRFSVSLHQCSGSLSVPCSLRLLKLVCVPGSWRRRFPVCVTMPMSPSSSWRKNWNSWMLSYIVCRRWHPLPRLWGGVSV